MAVRAAMIAVEFWTALLGLGKVHVWQDSISMLHLVWQNQAVLTILSGRTGFSFPSFGIQVYAVELL